MHSSTMIPNSYNFLGSIDGLALWVFGIRTELAIVSARHVRGFISQILKNDRKGNLLLFASK